MDIEDIEPKKKETHEIGSDLSTLSVSELEERIELMKSEIKRLSDAMEKKKMSRSDADAVFKI